MMEAAETHFHIKKEIDEDAKRQIDAYTSRRRGKQRRRESREIESAGIRRGFLLPCCDV
jgi:hypothetical protein